MTAHVTGQARRRRFAGHRGVGGVGSARTYRTALAIRYVILLVLALVFLTPFYLMVKTSLSSGAEISDPTFHLLPPHPVWGEFRTVLADPAFRSALWNSTVMAVLSTAGQIVLGAMAGYGLARIPNRAAGPIFSLVLVVLLIPAATTFLPNYVIVVQFGWVGSLRGLIIPVMFSAFDAFLFRQYFLNFPRELEEAGRIDGLGYLGTFVRIVVPNSLPFAAALTVLGFVGGWNSFLWPLVVSGSGSSATTVQIYISEFLTSQTFDYQGLFAAAVLSIVPLLVVFFVLQRYLVQGVAETGLTG